VSGVNGSSTLPVPVLVVIERPVAVTGFPMLSAALAAGASSSANATAPTHSFTGGKTRACCR
jgi:hypothetical protein